MQCGEHIPGACHRHGPQQSSAASCSLLNMFHPLPRPMAALTRGPSHGGQNIPSPSQLQHFFTGLLDDDLGSVLQGALLQCGQMHTLLPAALLRYSSRPHDILTVADWAGADGGAASPRCTGQATGPSCGHAAPGVGGGTPCQACSAVGRSVGGLLPRQSSHTPQSHPPAASAQPRCPSGCRFCSRRCHQVCRCCLSCPACLPLHAWLHNAKGGAGP